LGSGIFETVRGELRIVPALIFIGTIVLLAGVMVFGIDWTAIHSLPATWLAGASLVLAALLFVLRTLAPFCFGVTEILIASGGIWWASKVVIGGLADQPGTLQLAGAIYLVTRGLEHCQTGMAAARLRRAKPPG
jgi:hypothetical protein